MWSALDRVPATGQVGRRKITPEGGTAYYATIEMADNPSVAGTSITRALLLAMQGFEDCEISFNASTGAVTETYNNGTTVVTTFPTSDTIVETATKTVDGHTYTYTQTTTFNADGSISVEGGES